MRIRPDVELANLTDLGVRRKQNEDYFLSLSPRATRSLPLRDVCCWSRMAWAVTTAEK